MAGIIRSKNINYYLKKLSFCLSINEPYLSIMIGCIDNKHIPLRMKFGNG